MLHMRGRTQLIFYCSVYLFAWICTSGGFLLHGCAPLEVFTVISNNN